MTLVAPAAAKDRSKSSTKKQKEREPKGPPSLLLESLDLQNAKAIARVGGVTRAPDSRLFAFHDDHSRHFIALYARCEPAPPREIVTGEGPDATRSKVRSDDVLRCELDLPRPYLRARVRSMTVHLRGREVAADERDVAAKWSAAIQAAPSLMHAPPFTVAGVLQGDTGGPDDPDDDDPRGLSSPPPVEDPGVRLPKARPANLAPTRETHEEVELEAGPID
jgi:hypothetical protein